MPRTRTVEKLWEEKIGSNNGLSLQAVLALAEEYKTKLYEYKMPNGERYLPNTLNTKMTRMNAVVKKLYPNYYSEVVKVLIPPRDVKQQQIASEKKRIAERQKKVIRINYNEYIDIIRNNKNSDDFWLLCCVAQMASGRRNVELFKGVFNLIPNEAHHVEFSNVAKKRSQQEREAKYIIPIIELSPTKFIKIINTIQKESGYDSKTKNDKITHETNQPINTNIQELFNRNNLTTETIRTAYGAICCKLYKPDDPNGPEDMTDLLYTSQILAHKEHDVETVARGYSHVIIDGLDARVKVEKKEKAKKSIIRQVVNDIDGLGFPPFPTLGSLSRI